MRSKWMTLSRMLMTAVLVAVSSSCIPPLTGMSVSMVYVQNAPPPRRVEILGPMPGPGYAWVQGYWVYESRSYVWVPGHWQRPPKRHAKWHSGKWKRHNRGWYYVPGYWR